jgi:hypothetical protein
VLEFINKFLGEPIVRYNCAVVHCDCVALCLCLHDHSMRQIPVGLAASSIYRETPVRFATRPGSSFVTKRHGSSTPYKACFSDRIVCFIAKVHKAMCAGSILGVIDAGPSWHYILIAGIQYTFSFGNDGCSRLRTTLNGAHLTRVSG